jgi:predicted transcriptional regulator
MSPVKESAIRLIESLPDNCTLDDIHYHLYVREKVEHGMAAIDAGQIVTQEEAERRITQWAASSGQNPH